jgi:hypothetical protein
MPVLFQGKCENSTDLCGAKWTGSMCCGHEECLPASAFGLHFLGPEFSVENEGKLAIIGMALYGKSSLDETSGIT